MKSIGMARKVDDLGRIVLPVELRRQLGIRAGDELDIAVDGNTVLLHKIEARCVFCGAETELQGFRDKQVCADCLKEMTGPSRSDEAQAPPASTAAAPTSAFA